MFKQIVRSYRYGKSGPAELDAIFANFPPYEKTSIPLVKHVADSMREGFDMMICKNYLSMRQYLLLFKLDCFTRIIRSNPMILLDLVEDVCKTESTSFTLYAQMQNANKAYKDIKLRVSGFPAVGLYSYDGIQTMAPTGISLTFDASRIVEAHEAIKNKRLDVIERIKAGTYDWGSSINVQDMGARLLQRLKIGDLPPEQYHYLCVNILILSGQIMSAMELDPNLCVLYPAKDHPFLHHIPASMFDNLDSWATYYYWARYKTAPSPNTSTITSTVLQAAIAPLQNYTPDSFLWGNCLSKNFCNRKDNVAMEIKQHNSLVYVRHILGKRTADYGYLTASGSSDPNFVATNADPRVITDLLEGEILMVEDAELFDSFYSFTTHYLTMLPGWRVPVIRTLLSMAQSITYYKRILADNKLLLPEVYKAIGMDYNDQATINQLAV